ncbi:hypothetical protein D9M68_991870 [compost metagenome]
MRVLSPVLGSVTPKQALFSPLMIGGNQRAFCSALPCTTTGCRPNTFMCTAEAPDNPAPDPEMVSIISAASLIPRPAPPYSWGMAMPSQPSLASAV